MHYFCDVVTIDFCGLSAYSQYTSSEIKAVFLSLADIAAKNNLGEIWSETQLIGLDGDTSADFLAEALNKKVMGIDLSEAYLPGVGFLYYNRLPPFIPPEISRYLSKPTPPKDPFDEPAAMRRHRMAMFRHRSAKRKLEEIKPKIAYRQKRIQVIEQMVELSKTLVPFPLRAATDRITAINTKICLAYRQRIAYELGFEASIAARSFEPYNRFFEPVLTAPLEVVEKLTPAITEQYAFSIYLNLLSYLNSAIVYEAKKGEPYPDAAGRVYEGQKKRAYLHDQLIKAALNKEQSLNKDGRIALRLLLWELQDDYARGIHGNLYYPIWGRDGYASEELLEEALV